LVYYRFPNVQLIESRERRRRISYSRSAVQIERITSEGWERVRTVRLRSLRDSPNAFATTLTQDEARPLTVWRERLENDDSATFLASGDGQDVGCVFCSEFRGREGAAGLFGMWVAPEARGSGAGGALVDAVLEWAREQRYERILLEVGDENAPAIRLYERKGFLPTGNTAHLPPPRENVLEHERSRELGGLSDIAASRTGENAR
jgi:ribosomal protein S18 acetylase RimI-like enzyme